MSASPSFPGISDINPSLISEKSGLADLTDNAITPDVLDILVSGQLGDSVGKAFSADGVDFSVGVATTAEQLTGAQTSLSDPFADMDDWSSAIHAPTHPATAASGDAFGSGAANSSAMVLTDTHGMDWGQPAWASFSWEHGSGGSAAGAAGLAFDPGDTSFGTAPGGGDIASIDGGFSAKGGPGGGGGGGGSGVLAQYLSGSANGSAGYDILIEFKGTGWTADLQTAFKNAADYLTTVVTDDIGGDGLYRGKFIDDLYVSAEVKAIDGPGGILGQSGPTAVWTATELTAVGQMQFDVADATNYLGQGLWDDIVTHEMMHVLGFGSLWDYGVNPLVSGDRYTGAAGLAAYQAETAPGATYIPVETDGGSGTAGAHWDEQALTNELMTGYINNDNNPSTINDNYLSHFSVASLADLGYHIGYYDYPYDGMFIA